MRELGAWLSGSASTTKVEESKKSGGEDSEGVGRGREKEMGKEGREGGKDGGIERKRNINDARKGGRFLN